MKNIIMFRQLDNVVKLASKEDRIIWTIFSIFWAAEALLIVAIFNDHGISNELVFLTVSFVGLLISLVWFLVQRRSIKWLEYYEELIRLIEIEIEIPKEFSISPLINVKLFHDKVDKGIHVRDVMYCSGLLCFIAWSGLFLVFLIKICK
jgi:hypothetical protein